MQSPGLYTIHQLHWVCGILARETNAVQEMQEYLDFSLANLQIGSYLAASKTFGEQKKSLDHNHVLDY